MEKDNQIRIDSIFKSVINVNGKLIPNSLLQSSSFKSKKCGDENKIGVKMDKITAGVLGLVCIEGTWMPKVFIPQEKIEFPPMSPDALKKHIDWVKENFK